MMQLHYNSSHNIRLLRIPSLTGVFELLTDNIVNEERLADDFNLLHSLHWLSNEHKVSEQEAVNIHLQGKYTHVSADRATVKCFIRLHR